MSDAWDLLIKRDELSTAELVERDLPKLGPGKALLQVDRAGMTANNVTYALSGESLNYWDFFPTDEGWGRVPLWGYADVIASEIEGVSVGTRIYGYLPSSSHLVVEPTRIFERGFRDGSSHREDLDSAYNNYASTATDPAYVAENEDLEILYRPLFMTSFMLEDFLADEGFFGAEQIVVSSASSKTAYGTAFCLSLRADRPRAVALTSGGNAGFTRSLPYDDVVTYDRIESIDADRKTVYADIAGNSELRERIHTHLGKSLVYSSLVGMAHQDGLETDPDVPGPEPVFFFAPSQISKRRQDWGPGGIGQRYGATWAEFAAVVRDWVEVKVGQGPEELRKAWLDVLGGNEDPRTGRVISL